MAGSGSRWRRSAAAFAAAAAVAGAAAGIAGAVFSGSTSTGASFGAAPDFVPPSASASAILRTGACDADAGYLRPGGSYQVFAQVTDTGNPASGTASVTSDTSALTAGATATPLAAGSYAVSGTGYDYRSGPLTADGALAAGAKSYSLGSTDAAGNAGTQTGFPVVVDATAPAGADVQTANNGSTVGLAETGDTITFTFTEPIDPCSILAGWSGSATSVVVNFVDGGGHDDSLTVWNAADSSQLPLGTVDLGHTNGDYTGPSGATFGSSTMAMSGAAITVTLGTLSAGTVRAAHGPDTMVWTPSAAATDRAGNATSTASASESGALDEEF